MYHAGGFYSTVLVILPLFQVCVESLGVLRVMIQCLCWLIFHISSPPAGAHINPAVSITMATIGRFPWKKVPFYIIAQFLGAFMAAACVFGVYHGECFRSHCMWGPYRSLVPLRVGMQHGPATGYEMWIPGTHYTDTDVFKIFPKSPSDTTRANKWISFSCKPPVLYRYLHDTHFCWSFCANVHLSRPIHRDVMADRHGAGNVGE